jgi:peptidyl-prolyl cis-trans isomerase C
MIFKKTRFWALAAVCASLSALLGATPASAQNIAVVNGTPIPTSRADALVQDLVRQGQQDSPALQQAVREELVNREVLMQEAERRGIPNQPDVKAQLAVAQQSVVIRALLADYMQKNVPSPAELKARYDAAVAQIGGQEYHLHHILVDNEQQAKDLIAQLKAGANFEDLAKKYSKDVGSGKNGGDLDWSSPQAYVPEFAAAAVKLKKGEITDTPVKSQFGWHIIRLDDVRAVKVPSFDDVKAQLGQQVAQEKLQAFEQDLRQKAKIQ